MRLRGLVGVTLAGVSVAATASADPARPEWYGAIDLGGHARQDGQTPSRIPELGYKPGAPRFQTYKDFAGFARVGYRILPHLRLELEAGWRPAGMRQIVDEYQNGRPPGSMTRVCADAPIPADLPPNCGVPAGSVDSWTAMGNAINDFWLLGRPEPWLHPFAGLGVGVARVHLRAEGRLFGPTPPGRIVIDDADAKIAVQAFGGLTMRVNQNWRADLTYRFLFSGSHRWNTTTFSNIQLGPITGMYQDHALTFGLRYMMDAPSPPTPPHPQALEPPPAKTLVSGLPVDHHALTAEPPPAVQEEALYATGRRALSQATVADDAGAAGRYAYNARLAERRAKAAADQAASDGVAQTALDVS